MGLSLNKVAEQAPELLSGAEQAHAALQARNLQDLTAEIALVLDFSGSMGHLYDNGSVQRLVNKTLALATQLDDDGEIDLFIFGTHAKYLGKVSLANFRTVVADYTKKEQMGSTNYVEAISEVVSRFGAKKKLFGKKPDPKAPLSTPAKTPTLALVITDGEPNRGTERAVESELIIASYRPIFWQFLSIGGNIPFLQGLDDLQGRWIDNADYKPVANVDALSDADLIELVLDEYPSWVDEERVRGQIV